MTTIAALTHDGQVYMASDSCAIDYSRAYQLNEPKILKIGPLLIGLSGYLLDHDLIRYGWTAPTQGRDEDDDRYVRWTVARSLRDFIRNQRHLDTSRGHENAGWGCLIGLRGRLYALDSDFTITPLAEPYGATGSGGSYAMGVLHALAHTNSTLAPRERLDLAVQAACTLDPYTRAPVQHVTTQESA